MLLDPRLQEAEPDMEGIVAKELTPAFAIGHSRWWAILGQGPSRAQDCWFAQRTVMRRLLGFDSA